jgi:hypothetical protein
MQVKPKAKSIDVLSDKSWQQTFIWKFTNGEPKAPKKPISNRTANILVTVFIVVMSVLAIGTLREMYLMVIDKQCAGWETKPLDQVNGVCLELL